MKLQLFRLNDNGDDTTGVLFIDGKFECYTLEDEMRNVKIAGETRVPQGCYLLELREEVSPLTETYRKNYDYFDLHVQIKDVPNFDFVYLHVGNDDDDTDGCILLGNSQITNRYSDGKIGYSRDAFKSFYKKVYKALKTGELVEIEIRDEDWTNIC